MGDFLSPKRRDVVDRLRRRLEFYRQHQDQTFQTYDYIADTIYEQQRQEAYLLRQKWLESKAKKSSKSKPKSDTSQAEHRNVLVTKAIKWENDVPRSQLGWQIQNHKALTELDESSS
ncbi:hypothetical protein CHS0354_039895 [Potamilus streckersoni]|uniref:Neurogenic mastermind-like N-terminal domain-containing protein n=1 Tax=Potamilus streckersoni TaxID=2493646 RepID=A0AAE0TGT0_9BIVA|nr:hypothetical protein CHS0354_039895 [Potamilus streckersoni]